VNVAHFDDEVVYALKRDEEMLFTQEEEFAEVGHD
jgi:hypothetical protein